VDGATGVLVVPGDADGLAAALAGLLDDPETGRAMGRRGRRTVAAKFDVAANTKQLMRLFEDVLP
jgi:glycosyltransferase involved in cell wall biosynthesis